MKPKILVHICCAPDALYVLDALKNDYEVSGYFYNPNIHPRQEYEKRLADTRKVAAALDVPLIEDTYDAERWLDITRKHASEPEKGRRCDVCYAMRLEMTARKAVNFRFDIFATVMSLSPWKKADVMNRIGCMFARKFGIFFLEADFKKKDGFRKSVELSKSHGLYRQGYCGCEYSRKKAVEAVIFGVVQGVGFRPFIYRLAQEYRLNGWVKNIGFGVEIHLESEELPNFDSFFRALKKNKPELSQIEEIKIKPAAFQNCKNFEIKKSRQEESFVFISPDISVCGSCHREMKTPSDRRHLYPFINCTDCGPRYTIVKALPYDRSQTTMEDFAMCADCRTEFENPLDRRYHAQPIACPVCGPRVTLLDASTGQEKKGGIRKAVELIREGNILAVKGLGGFHLVCDALNGDAVNRLRAVKERKTKPFALMAKNIKIIRRYAHVCADEERQLLSSRRPIVLLQKEKDIPGIAPDLEEMGFMLPYTPLHYLLLEKMDLIVATSSNKKDSPIMKDEEEGVARLCDYILTHNRPIHMRADDSVMKITGRSPLFLRRARGYVPYPQRVCGELKGSAQILALGGELKDTISVYKNGYIVTSQFLGDLDEYQNYAYFEETIQHLTRLFRIQPAAVVTDLHPNFHTTRYAQKMGVPHFQVQHHFAHILAALIEHNIPPGEQVLGVAWDGFGYGEDGSAWGGEFLLAEYDRYVRWAHFRNVPLPGGDLAAKQPWRMALSYLNDIFKTDIPAIESLKKIDGGKVQGVIEMIKQNINSPLTSSCGRLFDAVSFLVGLAPMAVEFEAEAPMKLEAAADANVQDSYGFAFTKNLHSLEISFSPMIKSIVRDIEDGVPVRLMAGKFHNTLAKVIISLAEQAKREFGIQTVALTGGVFLNRKLLEKTSDLLTKKDYRLLRPVNYSPNDESISVGQVAYGLRMLNKRR